MSVSDILKELHGVKTYISSRSGVGGSHVGDGLVKSFVDSLVKMISVCPKFGPHEAASLADALGDNSPFDEAATSRLARAIDSNVDAPGSAKGKPCAVQRGQLLKHWWSYLTKSDWAFIQDRTKRLSAKMTLMLERANSLGIVVFDDFSGISVSNINSYFSFISFR